jgi:hypothetical protein
VANAIAAKDEGDEEEQMLEPTFFEALENNEITGLET